MGLGGKSSRRREQHVQKLFCTRKYGKGARVTGAEKAEGQWEARAEVGQELDILTWRPQRLWGC